MIKMLANSHFESTKRFHFYMHEHRVLVTVVLCVSTCPEKYKLIHFQCQQSHLRQVSINLLEGKTDDKITQILRQRYIETRGH